MSLQLNQINKLISFLFFLALHFALVLANTMFNMALELDSKHSSRIRRLHKALSLHVCMMCMRSGKCGTHLFLHCELARFLWGRLFGVLGEAWIEADSLLGFLQIKTVGFGSIKERKTLWGCAILAIMWVIWLERNN